MRARVWLLIALLALLQAGCASSGDTSDDTPGLDPVTSPHDDSHGWGTSVQNASH